MTQQNCDTRLTVEKTMGLLGKSILAGSPHCVEKYPYMQSFLQKCLKTLTIQLKDSLNNLSVLRTNS